MQDKFNKDLEIVYNLVKQNQSEVNSYFDLCKTDKIHNLEQKEKLIVDFLNEIDIEITDESKYAVIVRLVQLRDDSLVGLLNQLGFDEQKIDKIKESAYQWVSRFYLKRHESLIVNIEEKKLLTPFYRELLRGTHKVGVAFTSWQSSWTAHIVNGINRELYREFDGDEKKILEMINKNALFDLNINGEMGDRSYSVLTKEGDNYIHKSYKEAFTTKVVEVTTALDEFIIDISKEEDKLFNQKKEIIAYLNAIKDALNETDRAKLIPKWAEVDRAWMRVTVPLQIGHPLEYYEDKYRKAVALEWDLRLQNPNASEVGLVNPTEMFKQLYKEIGLDKKSVYDSTLINLKKTKLFISRPMLFYGAEFQGLFSAQVVPNDENVSNEMGKKIFAFSDNVLDSIRARPDMKIDSEIFPKEFLEKEKVLKENDKLWHKIYEITTIGHEFGHILWCDQESEAVMNVSGNFKNIEEYKATTGGLVTYFLNSDDELNEYIMIDTIKRAIKLIAWMEVGEVEAYYTEGLIHLKALFDTKVLQFNKNLEIDISPDSFQRVKKWYIDNYKKLAIIYLEKRDANEFLKDFVIKEGRVFKPIDERVKYFVNYYYGLYKEIGRETL